MWDNMAMFKDVIYLRSIFLQVDKLGNSTKQSFLSNHVLKGPLKYLHSTFPATGPLHMRFHFLRRINFFTHYCFSWFFIFFL